MNKRTKYRHKRRTTGNRRNRSMRKSTQPPLTADEFFARSEAFQDLWIDVDHILTDMRNEVISLPRASKKYNRDPRTVARLGHAGLRKLPNGRYAAKAWDRLLRVITVNTRDEGLQEVATRDSREASIAGQHSAAVLRFKQTGDDSALRKLPRAYIIDASGRRVELLMDLDEIERRGAGEFSYESIYARRA